MEAFERKNVPMPEYMKQALKELINVLLRNGLEVTIEEEGFMYVVEIVSGSATVAEVQKILASLPQNQATYVYVPNTDGEIYIKPKGTNIN